MKSIMESASSRIVLSGLVPEDERALRVKSLRRELLKLKAPVCDIEYTKTQVTLACDPKEASAYLKQLGWKKKPYKYWFVWLYKGDVLPIQVGRLKYDQKWGKYPAGTEYTTIRPYEFDTYQEFLDYGMFPKTGGR